MLFYKIGKKQANQFYKEKIMTNDYLNEWLHHLEINKNFSEHTFQSYGRDLI